jgi:hypothetical protein
MTEGAARLVDGILPHVPVRQWVLSLPRRLRYLLAWDHELCRAVLAIYARALLSFQRRRARRRGLPDGHSGCVTVIQRFGGGLNLNVHFHTPVLDGVFTDGEESTLHFRPLPPPTDEEVGAVLTTIYVRVCRLLRLQGFDATAADLSCTDPVAEESLMLAGISSASIEGRIALGPRAGRRVWRVGEEPDARWVLPGDLTPELVRFFGSGGLSRTKRQAGVPPNGVGQLSATSSPLRARQPTGDGGRKSIA